MTAVETRSIDTFIVVVERENGVDYVHIKRSDSDDSNKDAYLFAKGNQAAALKFLNSIAGLLGVGPIIKE